MRSEAVVGEAVTVQLPDGTTLGGRITQVSPVAQTPSASSNSGANGSGGNGPGASPTPPSSTIPVTIVVTGHRRATAGLDDAAVSVNFDEQQARNVLSVPVSALLATAGNRYAVQEAAAPYRLITVTPGLFAAGYVQISGPRVRAGLEVTASQG